MNASKKTMTTLGQGSRKIKVMVKITSQQKLYVYVKFEKKENN